MTGSFQVTSEALHRHAGTVAGLADELQSAFDVATGVRLTPEAYGKTCEPVTAMLNAAAEAAGGVLRTGIDALEQAAANLRDTATTYAETDAEQAGNLAGRRA